MAVMDKKDYEEPVCPMDNSMWVKKNKVSIPMQRVVSKEDEYLAKNDYSSAERHLLYWWAEAEAVSDERGQLLLSNELMGLYRKLGNGVKAKEYAEKALSLVEKLGFTNSLSGATPYLNSGTVYKAFGEPQKSLELFQKARKIYETELKAEDPRIAGLYNNMALTLVDLGRFAEAQELYMSAIHIIENTSKPDAAITWLNIADCVVAEMGMEDAEDTIGQCVMEADKLLDAVPEEARDSYYAFVCEKCSPVFDYYGYFLSAKKFKERSEAIYASNKLRG